MKDSLALSSKNKDFSCLCHLSINDWCEMHWAEIYSYIITSAKCCTTGVNLLLQVVFTWNFLPGVKLSLCHTDCSLLNLGTHYIRHYTTTDCTYAHYLLKVIITDRALPTGLFTKYILKMSMQGCLIFQHHPLQLVMCIRDLISFQYWNVYLLSLPNDISLSSWCIFILVFIWNTTMANWMYVLNWTVIVVNIYGLMYLG